jgi:hypothetical protein
MKNLVGHYHTFLGLHVKYPLFLSDFNVLERFSRYKTASGKSSALVFSEEGSIYSSMLKMIAVGFSEILLNFQYATLTCTMNQQQCCELPKVCKGVIWMRTVRELTSNGK